MPQFFSVVSTPCPEKYPRLSSIMNCPLSTRPRSLLRAFLAIAIFDAVGTNPSIVSCQHYFWKLFVMES